MIVSGFFDEGEELVALIRGEVLVIEKAEHEGGGGAAEDTGDEAGSHALRDFFFVSPWGGRGRSFPWPFESHTFSQS